MSLANKLNKYHIKAQEGSALIITLVLLTVLSLIGINSANNSALEEKMSQNSQLKNTAYQITKSEGDAQFNSFTVDITPLNDGLLGNTVSLVEKITPKQQNIDLDSELNLVHTGIDFSVDPRGGNSAAPNSVAIFEINTETELGDSSADSEQTVGVQLILPNAG